jgi:hypothetical protein
MYPDVAGENSSPGNGNGTGGWTANATWSAVDDDHLAPNDGDYGYSRPIGAPLTWSYEWNMTAPGAGVVINKISIYARLFAVSQNATVHDLTSVKGYVLIGGTRYRTAGQTVFGTTGAIGPNPMTYLLGDMAVNPATGIAWTIPDLQALVAGVEYVDQDFGSNTPESRLSQFYVQVEAQTIAQSIEGRRSEGTHYLMAFGRMHGLFTIVAPAQFLDVEPGTVIAVSDKLAPHPQGAGWGRKTWERRECLVLENEAMPMLRKARLLLFDLRFFRRMWWQPKTDLPYTEDGQGIPYLDAGGGRAIVRNQKAYVLKQLLDTQYSEVPINLEKWDADGLIINGGDDIANTLNGTFSLGAGNVFTSWTTTTAGSGTVVQDLADFLFDASGLRRSVVMAQGATAASTAYLTQTQSINGTTTPFGRLVYIFKRDAATGLVSEPTWDLQRSSDSWWWNDSGGGAWQVGAVTNGPGVTITNGSVYYRASKLVPFGAGAVTYTLRIGYMAGGTNRQAHFYLANLLSSASQGSLAAQRSVPVTTNATVTRIRDDVQLLNDSSVRFLDTTMAGGIELTILTLFDHAEMADGTNEEILFATGTASNYHDRLFYQRTNSSAGIWRYRRQVNGVNYDCDVSVSGTDLPVYGVGTSGGGHGQPLRKIAMRWTGADGELDLPPRTTMLMVNGVSGTPNQAGAQQVMGASGVVYLGWNPNTSQWGDITLLRMIVRKVCLLDSEVLRELG